MSHATDAQQDLYAADQQLDEVAQAFTATTEPEEIGMLQAAASAEEAAETLAWHARQCEDCG